MCHIIKKTILTYSIININTSGRIGVSMQEKFGFDWSNSVNNGMLKFI